ncbi:4-hydroxythreonine-4-phosphate dehydrogenase PdxA [Luminiphilus sp.]|nr:4-hydroxythreonine-4-phosphate dehydrogenase PdxA [Luminiphilus sp.]
MTSPRLVITAGEPAGIGPDVLLTALQCAFDARIAVVTDIHVLQERAHLLGIPCSIHLLAKDHVPQPHQPGVVHVLHTPTANSVVPGALDIANAPHVLQTLNTAADRIRDDLADALVTAPVQKSVMNDSGISFSGHTEFFANYFECEEVVMMLANTELRVALATTHLPLRAVPDAITQASLVTQLNIINESLKRLYGIAQPKIAMLGLNPHAGEGGHLGREEIDVLVPARDAAGTDGIQVSGPLPADTAFITSTVADADVVFAMFHDQGLPVLKARGFGASVNITLGLPTVRTSVDHGTALELAGSGKASADSMITAIAEAIICTGHTASRQ